MKKSVIEFSSSNIDFMYVMWHILYADFIYKKNILSKKGLSNKTLEEYKKMFFNYLDKKLYNFNASITSKEIDTFDNKKYLGFEIKIYPNYIYKVGLPLERFDPEIRYETKNGNNVILDLEYPRFNFENDIKIKKHEIIESKTPVKPKYHKKRDEEKPLHKKPKKNKTKAKPKGFKFRAY